MSVVSLADFKAYLRELTTALEQRNEKTILVLYGDHLPSLNLTRENMKSDNLYKTKYMIWDNFGLKKKKENRINSLDFQ